MTWPETEKLVEECMKMKLTEKELRQVYWGLPFFDGVNFGVILKNKYNITVS